MIKSEKGFTHLLLLVILIGGITLGVYLISQKTNLFPKASLSCKSDESRKPVEEYCMEGSLVQVSEWAESGSCKLFYEVTDRPC